MLFVQCCEARAAKIRIILMAPEPQLDEAPMASALNLIIKNVTNYSITVFYFSPQDKMLSYCHICLTFACLKKVGLLQYRRVGAGAASKFYLELVPHQHDAALQQYFLGLYRCWDLFLKMDHFRY
jgi:hypothetical protein